jgi:hypothetical protein
MTKSSRTLIGSAPATEAIASSKAAARNEYTLGAICMISSE